MTSWIGRGTIYLQQTRSKQALADFDAALKIDPASFEARIRRADTYNQMGQTAQANADFAQLAKSKPQRPDEFLKRAMALEAQGESDTAIADATKAIEGDAKLAPTAYMIRSSAYTKKNDLKAALGDADKAVEVDPDNAAGALLFRAGVKNRLKLYAEAAADAKKATELAPTNAAFRLSYSYSLARVGDYVGARRELDEAENLGQRSAWFYNNLAWLLSTADDEHVRDGAKAEEAINEAIELLPNEPRIWDTRAAVCAELGRFDEAVKWQKRCLATKSLTAEQRKNAQIRLELYQKHQPYREAPGS
jgi:tetratricopeptide (TPR) repeat protein